MTGHCCSYSVITHPDEAPQQKFMFCFDVFRQRHAPTNTVKPYMLRTYLLFILGIPAGSDDDAEALCNSVRAVATPLVVVVRGDTTTA